MSCSLGVDRSQGEGGRRRSNLSSDRPAGKVLVSSGGQAPMAGPATDQACKESRARQRVSGGLVCQSIARRDVCIRLSLSWLRQVSTYSKDAMRSPRRSAVMASVPPRGGGVGGSPPGARRAEGGGCDAPVAADTAACREAPALRMHTCCRERSFVEPAAILVVADVVIAPLWPRGRLVLLSYRRVVHVPSRDTGEIRQDQGCGWSGLRWAGIGTTVG